MRKEKQKEVMILHLQIHLFGLRFYFLNIDFRFSIMLKAVEHLLGISCCTRNVKSTISSFCVQIMRFFTNPRKPTILALARPDPKKNLTTLVKAFGECRPLRELANLVRLSIV